MQNPEEYQFEDSYLRTKRAWLGNGEWLDIHSSIDDHRTTITVSLECFVQKFFYHTDRKEDWPAIQQIFPQEYWYGGEKQHPAITELVHTHLLAHEADQLLQEYRSNPLDRHNVSHTLTDQQANKLTYQLREAGGNREAQVKAIAHLVDVDLNRPADLDMTLREYLYMQGSDPQELKDRLIHLLYDSNGLKISNDMGLVKSISEARIQKLAEQINAHQEQQSQQLTQTQQQQTSAATTDIVFTRYKGNGSEFDGEKPLRQAKLDNGGELYVFVDSTDSDAYVELRYRTPDGELYSSFNYRASDKIAQVFPRVYWYGHIAQHPAIVEAVLEKFQDYKHTYYYDERDHIMQEIKLGLGESFHQYDIDGVYRHISVSLEKPPHDGVILVNWKLLEEAAQFNQLAEDEWVDEIVQPTQPPKPYRTLSAQQWREQYQLKTDDDQQSLTKAAPTRTEAQADYAAPQYQQQQQLQQSQQAAGTQMSM